MKRSISTSALPLCLLLSACGGDGTSTVENIPPPPVTPAPTPTPTPTIDVETSWLDSPATRVGSYDAIAIVNQSVNGTLSSRFAPPAEFRIEASQGVNGTFLYKLSGPSGFLPGQLSNITLPVPQQSWEFNPGGPNFRYDNPHGDYIQYFGQNLKEYDVFSDGTKMLREDYDYNLASFQNAIIDLPSGERISESAKYDLGFSYVTMGEWSWGPVTVNDEGSATPTGDKSSVYFVYGDRTPASGIPVSGSATYDARTLGQVSGAGSIPFMLTADFSQRSISTEFSQVSLLSVKGSAPFSNDGSFAIPLAGTAFSGGSSQTATGNLDGAFFGPHAEQVGGVFSLQNSSGVQLMQDAFVGQQHH